MTVFWFAFLFIAIIGLFAFFVVALSNRLGLKRHQNIVNSDAFQKFTLKGFQVERVNDYVGITGVYDGYLCDIYYNWQTIVKSKVGRACVINIYFTPPKPLDKRDNANYDFIMAMKKKYAVSAWSLNKNYDFDWREGAIVMKNSVGLKNPSYERMEDSIKIAIDILKKENLKPINREDLTYIRNNLPYQSIPWIKTYHRK